MPIFDLTETERAAVAYIIGRELAENRYPFAPQLEPLRSAFRKLAPSDAVPEPPRSPRGKGRRQR